MEDWVNARVVGKLEFVSNVANFLYNRIWPIKSACKLLISSFEYRLLAVGM